MNQGHIFTELVTRAAAGKTLLEHFTTRYTHSTMEEWRARMQAGQVHADGKIASPDLRLTTGMRLDYHREPWEEPPAPLEFATLWDDDDLLIINKPSGLQVLPGAQFMQHTVLGQLQLRGIDAVPVHRLGRGTTGLLLLAKSARARKQLSADLRACSELVDNPPLQKTYLALVSPAADLPPQFEVTNPIGEIPHALMGRLHAATPTGRPALSYGTVLVRTSEATLVSVRIATGRPHQIRIHMACMGAPLVGDPLYGPGGVPLIDGNAVPGDMGYALHAWRLTLRHPGTGNRFSVECGAPSAFVNIVAANN